MAKFTVDTTAKLFIANVGITEFDVIIDLYSDAKEHWIDDNTANKHTFPFLSVGGNPIEAPTKFIPGYIYLTNGWRIRPQEADHTLSVTGGILLVDGGGDPFVNTVGAFTVRIRYEQPVQAIAVSSGATVTPSQQQIRDAMLLAPSGGSAPNSIDDQLSDIAADSLTQQEVRDAMLLAPGGASLPNSIDDQLSDISADSITQQEVRDAMRLAPTVSSDPDSIDDQLAAILAAISSGTLTPSQETQLREIWQRLSLDPLDPFTATPSQMKTQSGNITIDLTGDGVNTSTGTRQ